MQCDECREMISARLDGEDLPGESEAVDAHLTTCAACQAFDEGAPRVTRLARTRVVTADPDLLPVLLTTLDAWPPDTVPEPDRQVSDPPEPPETSTAPRARRIGAPGAVRAALAALGVGQLALAVSGIVAGAGTDHQDMELMGASAAHFSHESAAWNLALGVAFGWVAVRGRAAAPALVPVIGTFVALLTLLSVPDLAAGRVDPTRLLSHGLVVTGLLLLLAHRALTRHGGGGRLTGDSTGRPITAPTLVGPAIPADRRDGPRDLQGLKPTAHRAA